MLKDDTHTIGILEGLLRVRPDTEPGYEELPDGRWRIGKDGPIYPIPKAPLGKVRKREQ